jgi:hypothetical protein
VEKRVWFCNAEQIYNSKLLLFDGLQLTTRRLHWRTNHSFSLLGCRPIVASSSSVAGSRGGGNLAAAASGSVSRNLQFFSLWVGVILPGRDQKLAFSVKSGEVQKGAEDMESSHKYTNRLAHEHSPYLLQHAHNPVDWYPWGEDAFTKAQAEDKPIFLSGIIISLLSLT